MARLRLRGKCKRILKMRLAIGAAGCTKATPHAKATLRAKTMPRAKTVGVRALWGPA